MTISLVGLEPFSADPAFGESLKQIRLGVGFIPNVQFAPLYVSQKKGYYAEEGLDVVIEYGYENDFVALAAQGEREFAVASGDQVILARGQGLPITYIMKWYERYPVALVSPKSKGIKTPQDLVGKSVGLPGFFGASFIGWKALSYAGGLEEQSVTVKKIGFTQVASLQQNLVDSAIGYIANEPIQLKSLGIDVTVLEVSDYIDLVSNGLVVGDRLMKENPDLVKRMVRATLKGLIYTIQNPKQAFAVSRQVIPEITDDQVDMQMKVLTVSIDLWKNQRPGVSNREDWQTSVDFLSKTGIAKKALPVDHYFTNQFIQ